MSVRSALRTGMRTRANSVDRRHPYRELHSVSDSGACMVLLEASLPTKLLLAYVAIVRARFRRGCRFRKRLTGQLLGPGCSLIGEGCDYCRGLFEV